MSVHVPKLCPLDGEETGPIKCGTCDHSVDDENLDMFYCGIEFEKNRQKRLRR